MPTTILLKLAACLALVAALLFGWHSLTHHYDKQGYERRAAEDKTAADQQAERNRDLQRQAEKSYVVKRDTQDHYFTVTTKEIIHDAAPLAACPVPDSVRVQLNAARECALGDPSSACVTDEPVRNP